MQPGDLGDDEETGAPAQETSTTTSSTTSTTAASTTSTSVDVTTTGPDDTTTTTAPESSGIGDPTTPNGGSDGVADTGMESLLGPGLALAALGLALRRTAARAS